MTNKLTQKELNHANQHLLKDMVVAICNQDQQQAQVLLSWISELISGQNSANKKAVIVECEHTFMAEGLSCCINYAARNYVSNKKSTYRSTSSAIFTHPEIVNENNFIYFEDCDNSALAINEIDDYKKALVKAIKKSDAYILIYTKDKDRIVSDKDKDLFQILKPDPKFADEIYQRAMSRHNYED